MPGARIARAEEWEAPLRSRERNGLIPSVRAIPLVFFIAGAGTRVSTMGVRMGTIIRISDYQPSGRQKKRNASNRRRPGGASAQQPAIRPQDLSPDREPREFIEKTALQLFDLASQNDMPFLAYLLIMAVEEARGR